MQGGGDRELGRKRTKMSSGMLLVLLLFGRVLEAMFAAWRLLDGAEVLISLSSRNGLVEVGRAGGAASAQGLLKGELRGEGEAPPPKRL